MLASDLVQRWAGLFLAAAVASYVAGWAVLAVLRRWQLVDRPNARSSHAQPTPRGGGVAIMLTFLGGAGWLAFSLVDGNAWLIVVSVAAVAVMSFCDDRFDLSWRVRLGGHLFVAAVGALWFRPELGGLGWLLVPVLVLLLAGHANAFNFMDGINGIASGQAVVAGIALAVLALEPGGGWHPAGVLALLLAGSAAGFLPHNFPRARMFMGDVGSVPLGLTLMLLSAWLARDQGFSLWLPLLVVHSGFMLDTAATLVRRWQRGDRLQEAHREHFYQLWVRAGWSHSATTMLFLGISGGGAIMAAWGWIRGGDGGIVAFVSVLAWGLYFAMAEGVFRRFQRAKTFR